MNTPILTSAIAGEASSAITSALPQLDGYRVEICLGFLTLLMLGNLRGIRESGRIFAVPTYFFVFSIFVLIAAGLYRYATGTLVPLEMPPPPEARLNTMSRGTTARVAIINNS